MKSQISSYGIPDELISDSGPQFAGEEFPQFMKDYDIKHITSSPYHPQANGQAQRTVQTVKRLLVTAKDPYKALLDYRNSPLDTGFSPAQLFLGRRLKRTLPTTSKLIQPGHGSSKEPHSEMVSRQQKQKFYCDKNARGNLSAFPAGDPVMMKFGDTWKRAEGVTLHSTPRSYIVRDERKQYRRNRKMLWPTVIASRDSDLPVTVPSQSETERVANQESGQNPSQSDVNSQMVGKESVVKTKSARAVKLPARFCDNDTCLP